MHSFPKMLKILSAELLQNQANIFIFKELTLISHTRQEKLFITAKIIDLLNHRVHSPIFLLCFILWLK